MEIIEHLHAKEETTMLMIVLSLYPASHKTGSAAAATV
jgi:hypothetical protein